MRKFLAAAVVLVAAATATACDAARGAGAADQITGLRMMVPNNPGGGYDITARTAAKVMEEADLARSVEVFNLPGASGTIGLGRLVREQGNGKLVMQMGLGVVGSVYTEESPSTLADTTPIARLIELANSIVVPKDSRYTDIGQLIEEWKANPGKVAVGGGSSPGGPDHLSSMLIAEAIGLKPTKVDYVRFDGGGELLAAVLGNEVAFGVTGVGEYISQIEAGELRVLAVTGPERVNGVDAPTLKESGVDVEFTNWRGVVAPPGISEEDRKALVEVYTRLHDSNQWKDALVKNGWYDAFLTAEEFGTFMAEETDRVSSVLKELGLA